MIQRRQRRRARLFLVAAVVGNGLLSYSLAFGPMGMPRFFETRRVQVALEAEIRALRDEIQTREGNIKRLTGDKHYIEGIARSRLGLSKDGELIYEFVH